jgi:hypothetical protein
VRQVRVLRPGGGLHPGLHPGRARGLRRAVALRPLLRGGAGRGGQGHDGERPRRRRRGAGGRAPGPHGLLRKVQAEPRVPGRRRHAPDAAQVLQVTAGAGRVVGVGGVARRKIGSATHPRRLASLWAWTSKTRQGEHAGHWPLMCRLRAVSCLATSCMCKEMARQSAVLGCLVW